MKPDYESAALKATEIITTRNISSAPIDPMPILKQLPNVMLLSYAEMAVRTGIDRENVVQLFGDKNQDAVTSVINDGGKLRYFVAYNQRLPFYMLQRALARELGHIVLGHDGTRPEEVRTEEAMVFARHLLCPRPVIRALQESGIKLTVEVLGSVTGCYERCLAGLRKTPGVHVPAIANRIMRGQFEDYINDFVRFQAILQDEDESSVADFGTYMDGYEE
jgi:hypothetical protein